jgi:hypothetical protein
VVTINNALCQAQKVAPGTFNRAQDRARRVWEGSATRRMTLLDALDLCRESCDARPFTFNNGNTFSAIAKTLLEDWLRTMPPLESQIVRTTVAHYVAGLVSRKELIQVLRHFDSIPRPVTASVSPRTDTTTVALPSQGQRVAL